MLTQSCINIRSQKMFCLDTKMPNASKPFAIVFFLFATRPEPETIKIFPDCNRTINDCNSTVKVLDGPVTAYANFYSFGLRPVDKLHKVA